MSGEEGAADCPNHSSSPAGDLQDLRVTGSAQRASISNGSAFSSSEKERCPYAEGADDGDDDDQDIVYATAAFDGNSEDGERITLRRFDKVRVIERTNSNWWWAKVGDQEGWVPVNHLCCEEEFENLHVKAWQDDEYFSSYAPLALHREMLGDVPRTSSYQRAVQLCASHIEGKVVLDVGCGTGILSMFCARDGRAKKVYAVEASDISERAEETVRRNRLDDRIVVIRGKVEDIDLPEKVDLIISEWMGTLLLFELMLEAVLRARDRFLKPGGIMWPSNARLFLVPCSAQAERAEKVGFWSDLYGFDFSALQPTAVKESYSRPIFNHRLVPEDCLSNEDMVVQLDLGTVDVNDLEEFNHTFDFTVVRDGPFHGFASWFDVTFGGWPGQSDSETVVLCTGPGCDRTHWHQDLFMMDEEVDVAENDAVCGTVTIWRHPDWRRHLRIQFVFDIVRKSHPRVHFEKSFFLWK